MNDKVDFPYCFFQYFQIVTIFFGCSEDEPIPNLLNKKEQPKNKWDDEDLDDNAVKESWEDEDEPADVCNSSIILLSFQT